ncbi:hypothetical protein OZX69_02905 [Lactobacillus sp. ESL0731]|uniref:hypothetical protein n=1 Tax=unclassified Lactobacillus TaxID=2620435 RepID=UPI0023FA1E3F|nr:MULTISPECIES: hypothetical protein [unclassified Lactobacillus]WEV51659.1 hypothetical protein OZX63_02905 [Lactobacillus sp. ESL0700]WEV62788.1 hypothetical protein OZX69_02905 [Lactobacillus sp. ESL0731]
MTEEKGCAYCTDGAAKSEDDSESDIIVKLHKRSDHDNYPYLKVKEYSVQGFLGLDIPVS